MRPYPFTRWALIPLLGAALACNGDDSDGDGDTNPTGDDDDDTSLPTGDTGDTDPTTAVDVTASVAPSAHIAAAFRVTIDSSAPGEAWVEYGLDGAFDHTTPRSATATTHDLPLLGMKAGRTYSWRAVVETAGGEHRSDTQTLLVPAPPPQLAGTRLVATSPAANIPYVLISVVGAGGSFAYVVDADADIVWWHAAGDRNIIITPEIARDGLSFLWGEYDSGKDLDIGRFYRVRVDGSEITSTRMLLSHHAAVEKPDGTIGWLGLDFRDIQATPELNIRMATDRIYEAPEGAADDATPTELFNTFDQQDPPVFTCEHIGEFDRFGERDVVEWTHGNSLTYVDSEDAYYLNAKQTDWVFKIDGTTGELLWQLNGVGGDFMLPGGAPVWTSADAPTLFSHAHMSHAWEGGMVTFDNGDHRRPQVSSAAEIVWDETTMTAERVWEFYHPDGEHSLPLGDVRKRDDGSYLISWGAIREVMHVDADHTVLWHAEVPTGYTIGRVRPIDDLYALSQ